MKTLKIALVLCSLITSTAFSIIPTSDPANQRVMGDNSIYNRSQSLLPSDHPEITTVKAMEAEEVV